MVFDVGSQELDVDLQRRSPLADLRQLHGDAGIDLALDPRLTLFEMVQDGAGPLLGIGHHAGGLGPRLLQRRIGRPLGEHKGAPEILVRASFLESPFGQRRALRRFLQATLELVEGLGDLLDELVDLVGAVAPPLFCELHVPDPLRRHSKSHARPW